MDGWERWQVASSVSVENVEGVYLFGTMITGQRMIGLRFALVYRQIRKMMAVFQGPLTLPIMIFEEGKAVAA